MDITKKIEDVAEQTVIIGDTLHIALGASSILTKVTDRLYEADAEELIEVLDSLKKILGPFQWALTMEDSRYRVEVTSSTGLGFENFWPTAHRDDETFVRHFMGASANSTLYCAVSCLALAYIKSHSKKANICQ